jgi:hypothetical protein
MVGPTIWQVMTLSITSFLYLEAFQNRSVQYKVGIVSHTYLFQGLVEIRIIVNVESFEGI